MKRSGFTMIELIFVIVILGILAAVAIPRLAATRDDAKASKAATNLSTYINDIGSYYTSKGSLDLTQSNVTLANDGCFTVASSGTSAITITTASASVPHCASAHSIAASAGNSGTKTFGGTGVTY